MVCLRRLDDFLLSQELNVQVKKVNISPGYCSDHALVSLELKVNDIKSCLLYTSDAADER